MPGQERCSDTELILPLIWSLRVFLTPSPVWPFFLSPVAPSAQCTVQRLTRVTATLRMNAFGQVSRHASKVTAGNAVNGAGEQASRVLRVRVSGPTRGRAQWLLLHFKMRAHIVIISAAVTRRATASRENTPQGTCCRISASFRMCFQTCSCERTVPVP